MSVHEQATQHKALHRHAPACCLGPKPIASCRYCPVTSLSASPASAHSTTSSVRRRKSGERHATRSPRNGAASASRAPQPQPRPTPAPALAAARRACSAARVDAGKLSGSANHTHAVAPLIPSSATANAVSSSGIGRASSGPSSSASDSTAVMSPNAAARRSGGTTSDTYACAGAMDDMPSHSADSA